MRGTRGEHGPPSGRVAALLGAALVVLATITGSLVVVSVAGASTPDSPIADVTGTPDVISVDAPFTAALSDGGTNEAVPGWTLLVNDDPSGVNPLGGANTIWADGDVLNIVVAPPSAPGGINHVESGDFISFASVPFVGVVGTDPPTTPVTPPILSTTLSTYPGDRVDANDAGITDDLAITFSGPVEPADTAFIVQIGDTDQPVTYNVGTHDPPGTITTANSSFVSALSGAAVPLATSDSGGPPITVNPPTEPPGIGVGTTVQRISGSDAIDTSIAVSQGEFPIAGTALAVVLARSDFFADALAGGPLAAAEGGPLLITPGGTTSGIDPRVSAEIQRVLPIGSTIFILGGPLALDPSIDVSLQALGYDTMRIAGVDEYATAVDIAQQLGNPSTIFEATGLNFADALSAVPAAISVHGAIVLTQGNVQAPETTAYLAAHPGDTRYAIGGPLAAAGADPGANAVFGQDQFGTSAAVATTFFPSATSFGAATGTNFPDALSGGVFMGTAANGPMLLVAPSGALPSSITGYLVAAAGTIAGGYLFGGPLAVGDDVFSELEQTG